MGQFTDWATFLFIISDINCSSWSSFTLHFVNHQLPSIQPQDWNELLTPFLKCSTCFSSRSNVFACKPEALTICLVLLWWHLFAIADFIYSLKCGRWEVLNRQVFCQNHRLHLWVHFYPAWNIKWSMLRWKYFLLRGTERKKIVSLETFSKIRMKS